MTMAEVTPEFIEKWALENPKRALTLGKALLTRKKEALGDPEDAIQDWAAANEMRARMLFMSLMGRVIKLAAE